MQDNIQCRHPAIMVSCVRSKRENTMQKLFLIWVMYHAEFKL